MKKINVAQICEVRILGRRENELYEWKPEKKSWLFGNTQEGFYYTLTVHGPKLMTVEEIESDGSLVCDNKVVYFRPRIYVKMSNGDTSFRHFDTKAEALRYFETSPEFSGIKWVYFDYE